MTDTTTPETAGLLQRPGLPGLAWRRITGSGPTIVWLGGFRSDMTGTKAQALADEAVRRDWSFLRFDYRAHGASEGRWEDCTIGDWRTDALDAIDALSEGPVVLVGSSMGGWMACLAALARPERIRSMVLIAPAPDFAGKLMRPKLPPEALRELELNGSWVEPSAYDEPWVLTRRFLDEGDDWNILDDGPIAIDCPVRILQGGGDLDVPWEHALRLARSLRGDDVVFSLIRDGDHRLSRDQDVARLLAAVAEAAA